MPTRRPTTYPITGSTHTATLKAAQQYYDNGLASSSRSSYNSQQKIFINVASQYENSTDILPVKENTLIYFMTYYADTLKASYNTIRRSVFAIQDMQINAGYPKFWSSFPRAKKVLTGIRRIKGTSPDSRVPFTYTHLHALYNTINHSSPDDATLWAAATVAFHGLLRASEFTQKSTDRLPPFTVADVNRDAT